MWNEFGTGLVSFLTYFVSGGVAIVLYTVIYTAVTHHNEFTLIKAQNAAAAVAFTGSLLGFVIAITRLIENSVSLVGFAIWGAVAIMVQLIVYGLARLTFPEL